MAEGQIDRILVCPTCHATAGWSGPAVAEVHLVHVVMNGETTHQVQTLDGDTLEV